MHVLRRAIFRRLSSCIFPLTPRVTLNHRLLLASNLFAHRYFMASLSKTLPVVAGFVIGAAVMAVVSSLSHTSPSSEIERSQVSEASRSKETSETSEASQSSNALVAKRQVDPDEVNSNLTNINSRITVVGSLNADLYYTMDKLPRAGETIDGKAANIGPGGKGGNQAGAASGALNRHMSSPDQSGRAVDMAARIGSDAHGEMFLTQLPIHGVRTHSVTISDTEPTGQALILLDSKGQNSIIIAPGANEDWPAVHDLTNLSPAVQALDKDAASSVIPFSVAHSIVASQVLLLQREVPDLVNLQAAKIAKAVQRSTDSVKEDVIVMLDVGGRSGDIDWTILPYLDYITLNETELSRVVGKTVDIIPVKPGKENGMYDIRIDTKPIVEAASVLLHSGAKNVLVTLGEHGSLIVGSKHADGKDENSNNDTTTIHPVVLAHHCAFKVEKVVDTTGAGDCFRGYFAVGVAEKMNLEETLAFATSASTLCVQRLGTLPSMPSRDETIDHCKEAQGKIAREWEQTLPATDTL